MLKVHEIMTDYCQAIRNDDPLGEAANLMRDMDVGTLPVIDSRGTLVGVLTDRDLVVRGMADGQDWSCPIEDVMTPEPHTCRPDDDILAVAERMQENRIRRMLVTDGEGHVVGVVSLADMARHRATQPFSGDMLSRISQPA